MVDFQHLYDLTQENNAMLKEIVSYIRELKDPNNIQNDWQREMFFNILSDIVANRIQGLHHANLNNFRR